MMFASGGSIVGVIGLIIVVIGVSTKSFNVATSFTLLPRATLQTAYKAWGETLVDYLAPIALVVLGIFVGFIAALPGSIHVQAGNILQWAPSGGQFEANLRAVDTHLALTDRSNYVIMKASNGSNLLDNPADYLRIFERVVYRIFFTA